MAITAAHPAKVAVDGFYASSTNQLRLGDKIDMIDSTTFATLPFATFVRGLKSIIIEVNGFQDFSTLLTNSSAERTRGMTGPVPVSVAPDGAVSGAYAQFSAGQVETMARYSYKVGEIPAMSIVFQPVGMPVVEGFQSDPGLVDRTATYVGANAQLGAVTATKHVWANVHVLDNTGSGGTPTITPRIESDTVGFASPTTIATGVAMSPAVGTGSSQTISVLGPFSDDYFRVACTISGTTPHLLIFAVVGVA